MDDLEYSRTIRATDNAVDPGSEKEPEKKDVSEAPEKPGEDVVSDPEKKDDSEDDDDEDDDEDDE